MSAGFLQASSLSALPGLRHAFFTREGGVSSGLYASLNGGLGSRDEPEHVTENRARMARAMDVTPDRFVSIYQVHSPDVAVVEQPWSADARPKADALVTRTEGLALVISTADCGPVLFADPKSRVIGAAHAGWRGALTGVLEATLNAMEALGARRDDIVTALGPMISQANYEVGPDFIAAFDKSAPGSARFFQPSPNAERALFDLPGYIAARLAQAGVRQIEDLKLCTYADPARFFSYRRSQHRAEADFGRHLHAIRLM